MTDTITLTREQWNEVYDGLVLIRDAATDGAMYEITAALSTVGLDKSSITIAAVQNNIADEAARLQYVLIDADDAKPKLAPGRTFAKWLSKLNKSNREA